jgi:zinc finger HIT domain-containing protein 1
MSTSTNKSSKRSSTRTVVVSKAMAKVDEGARFEARDRRLQMLEADNYVEAETSAGGDDAAYDDDEDGVMQRKKKQKLISKVGVKLNKWALRRVKPLERVVFEEGYKKEGLDDLFGNNADTCVVSMGVFPNYVSVNATSSNLPSRKFCSVCGLKGIYACNRCGMRYCTIKCNNQHKETRCLKFNLF